MFFTFSQTVSVGEALEKTFDGRNPCELCKHIRDAKKETDSEKAPQPAFQLYGVIPPIVTAIAPPSVPLVYPAFESKATVRALSPPTPPPRRLG